MRTLSKITPVHRLNGPFVVLLLVLLLAGVRAFAQAPISTTSSRYAFTILSSATPRILHADETVAVRLRLRNDGTETWSTARLFHVAYHWRKADGTMLARDGVRTDLPRPVPPGGTTTVEARLTAPAAAGIYRLQWDMVRENVTWFSDRDHRPPASTLVLVAPGAAAVAFVTPFLLALLGWIAIRRAVRAGASRWVSFGVLGIADVAWAATSIFGTQVSFLGKTSVEPSPTALWASAATAIIPCAIALVACPRRWRGWIVWGLAATASLALLSDLLYFRFFGDVIAVSALRATGQAGDVWKSALSLAKPSDLWWLVGPALGVLLIREARRLPQPSPRERRGQRAGAVLALMVVALSGQEVGIVALLHERALNQEFRNLNVVEALGPFGYHLFDAWHEAEATLLQPPLTPAQQKQVFDWFAGRAPLRAGVAPWFGVAAGSNVLVLQVESMQGFVVGLHVNGQAITPNLNRWRRRALWFSNATDQTSEGRTSDAEFATMISLLPLDHGAVAFRYPTDHYVGLPKVLADHGYTTLSAVPFDGTFWNRKVTHPQYGVRLNLFANAFKPGEVVGWGLNDRDFLRQMAPRLARLRQPFFAWLITLSLHHPFDSFPDNLKTLKLGRWDGTPFGNYLQAMHFFDAAFGELMSTMRASGLLNRTIVVVYGDHDAGFPWRKRFADVIGIHQHVLDWSLQDRVPLLIHVPGDQPPRGERSLPAGLTDVAPTVLDLLGINAARYPYIGRNLLGDPGDDPLPRPYGDWLDSRHFYFSRYGKSGQPACDDIDDGATAPLGVCSGELRADRLEVKVSREVIVHDLQQDVGRVLASAR